MSPLVTSGLEYIICLVYELLQLPFTGMLLVILKLMHVSRCIIVHLFREFGALLE